MDKSSLIERLRVATYPKRREFRRGIVRTRRWLLRAVFGLPTISLDEIVDREIPIATPILDDICLPPYKGPPEVNDYLPFMTIVKSIEPRIVIELGTAHGNLTANICRECPSVRVYTVNAPVEAQTGNLVTYKLTPDQIGRVYRRYGFQDRVVQIFENTQHLDLSRHLNGELADAAVVDACHDTDYVINDFSKVQPFVRRGGVVFLHDTHPSMEKHLHGSYVACMRLRMRGFDINYLATTWWGIWFKP
jgi:predicted O-methyltransferase YrrM